MKTKSILGVVLLSLCSAGFVFAGPQAKSYQVTGPVIEVTDTIITLKAMRKGEEETWQIARDAGTKIQGELKVGAKVTVHYRMVATDVEVKADKSEAAKPKKADKLEKK